MCGISGIYNAKKDFTKEFVKYNCIIGKMIQDMKHRGPDNYSSIITENAVFGHVRLSIIDLVTGDQPLTILHNENVYHIIFNGEIYNFKQLKSRIEKRGHMFLTTSDTEVILRGYIEYGTEFVKELNGIFAFAIYDEARHSLLLARDQFGVKPLYYSYSDSDENELIFASEINSLFASSLLSPKINNDGFNQIFSIGPSKVPGSGVFSNVNEVLPGELITFTPEFISHEKYFQLRSMVHEDDYATTIEKVRYYVTDSIKKQMVSDVPIASLLSGGIDSSIVTAVLSKELKKEGRTLTTYSFDFTDNNIYFKENSFQPTEDRPFVDIMKKHLNTEHIYLECDYQNLADLLYASVDSRGLPTMADVDSSLQYFIREVSNNHKVVLTGECADEVFGGYPWFYRSSLLDTPNFPWIQNLEFKKSLLDDSFAEALNMDDYIQNLYYSGISEIGILPNESPLSIRRRRVAYLSIKYFMQTLLDRMDRTSMKSGVEARVPFADPKLVSYVFNIPWEFKYQEGTEKHILRTAMKDLLPDEILNRKKSPYPKTYHPAYEKVLSDRLRLIISDVNAPLNRFINRENVIKFLDSPKDYGKPWYGQLMASPQMIAYLIQVNYWLKKYRL